ncbi:MAG: glutathione peroxidase [Paracoccaceae bacterium]
MLRRAFLIGTACLPALAAHAGDEPAAELNGAHLHSFEAIEGGTLALSQFAGRPVMVVNTASKCGFTYQYDGLQSLYDTYRDQGLVVVGVPSDDFGGQEYATDGEVKQFCEVNFNLDFPMAGITKVRGRDKHAFYDWAEMAFGPKNTPSWNFHKYLVGPDGNAVAAFNTRTDPMSPEVRRAVEALLGPHS